MDVSNPSGPNEIKDCNVANPTSSDFSKTGHFTQLVWMSSITIGAGRVCGRGGPAVENRRRTLAWQDNPKIT